MKKDTKINEDEIVYQITKERLKTFNPDESISKEEMMRKHGINQKDIDAVPNDEAEFE